VTNSLKTGGIACLVIAYPFLSAYLVHHGWSATVLALFAALTLWRALQTDNSSVRLGYGLLAAFLLVGAVFAKAYAVRLIPVFVYLGLTALFGYTLMHPPTLIERMVRLQFPEFKPGISEYLRQVTWVWTAFFAANVVICAVLAVGPNERVWMLYTGIVVYLLMAALALGEYFYRPRRFPSLESPPLLDSIMVMARHGHAVFRELRG
jgi:uncharacterized membrane protein